MKYDNKRGVLNVVEINPSHKKTKKAVLFFTILVALILVSFGAYRWINRKNEKVSSLAGLSNAEIKNKVINNFIEQSQKDESTAASIKSLEDLKRLEEQNQIAVGPLVMRNLATIKDYASLLDIANFLVTKGGSIAIKSLKYCYTYETDPVKKSDCLAKLNQESVKQKIIPENSKLPESYLTIREGE